MKKLLAAILLTTSSFTFANDSELSTFDGSMDMICGHSEQVLKFMEFHGYAHNLTKELINMANAQNAYIYKFNNKEGKFQYWVEDTKEKVMCMVANSAGTML